MREQDDLVTRAKAEVFTNEVGTCWLLADSRTMLDALSEVAKLEDVAAATSVEISLVCGHLEDLGNAEGIHFYESHDEGGMDAWKVALG